MESKQIKTIFIVICSLVALSSANAQTLEDGLVAYYPFNGNADDESDNSNNGTVNGATLTTDHHGNTDSAYDFDGSSIIRIPDSDSLDLEEAEPATFSVWVNVAVQNRGHIFGKRRGDTTNYMLDIVNGGRPMFRGHTHKGIEGDDPLPINQWIHLACTWDGTTCRLFIDGELSKEGSDTPIRGPDDHDFVIGGTGAGHTKFNGKIDELRIYNRALSGEEVKELYDFENSEAGWSQSTFTIVKGEFNWEEAKADAEARGGRLAVLNTQERIDDANEFLNSQGTWPVLWLGLTDEINEGDWRWITGEELTANNWNGAEPNNAQGGEDFATLWHSGHPSTLRWNDLPPDAGRPVEGSVTGNYLLEMPGLDLNEALVAYYPFNGNAEDESGNDNNGTINGATLATDRNGNADSAYSFESSSIVVPDSTSLDLGGGTGFAMSAWINPRQLRGAGGAVNDWDAILSKHQTHPAYSLKVNNTGINAQFARSPGDGAPNYGWKGTVIELNAWSHLLVNYDNDKITCYLNGIAITTIDAFDDLDPQTTNTPFTIGTGSGNSDSNSFNGLIDDVRIYNRALSGDEVIALYDLEKPALEQGLVAYYPFNGNADDASGSDNNGTVNGATLTTDRNGNVDSAYDFDGVDDNIQTHSETNLPLGTEDFTINLWMTFNKPFGPKQGIFLANGQQDQFQFMFDTWTGVKLQFYTGGGAPPLSLDKSDWNSNQWYCMTLVRAGNVIRAYRDAVELGSAQTTRGNDAPAGKRNLSIGARMGDQHPWKGNIDDIRIYNRALSEEEVTALYDLEKPTLPDPSPPVLTLEQFYESLPDEITITIDATPESGFPEDFTYQWYFGTFLIPGVLGGNDSSRIIDANEDNNGLWRVVVSNSEGSAESIFYFMVYADTDGDGISDGREEFVIGSDPNNADTDGDGIKDYDEVYTYGTSFSKADTDGDGFDDLFEINTKYDPLNQESTPEAYLDIQTAVELKFNAAKDLNYKIENSVDLENWSAIETGVLGKGGLIKRLYSIDDYPGRYFRVKRE